MTSSFIYLVLTFAIFLLFNLNDSYLECASSDISPLNQSEIGDQNWLVTLYSLASQKFAMSPAQMLKAVNDFRNC